MNTIFCVFLSTLILGVNCIVVHLKDGAINGTTTRTKEGRLFHKFLGIPYAKPPINELRFKPPVSAEPWTDIKDVTKPAPICVQRTDTAPESNVGQEDCLYLNVYIPDKLLNSSGRVPVIVVKKVHIFDSSTNDYPADYFMERDIIFVAMNYRLGLLGFLAVNDFLFISNDLISGNFGLKDQVFALKWVKENIGQFGGDPNNVTLMGESAGAASAHFHMFSPLSKGLFQKAIMESGNAFSPWSHFPTGYRVKSLGGLRLDQIVASQLLLKTKCYFTTNQLKCLQNLSTEEFTKPGGLQNYLLYLPTIELNVTEGLAFLPQEPNAMNYQTLVPWLTGINSGEGALIVPTLLRNGSYLAKMINSNKEFFLPLLNLYIISANQSDMPDLTRTVNNFYFGTEDIGLETALQAVNMITDSSWLYPFKKTVISGPTLQYLYLYDHRGTLSFADFRNLTIDLGVGHGDEVPLLYRMKQYEVKRSIEDRRVSDTLLKYWINFAISADPNRNSKEKLWKPMQTQDENFEYLHIKSDGVVMEENLYPGRYTLWKLLPTGW